MEPFEGHCFHARVEVIGQRQTLPKGRGRKVTGLRASIYDSGAAECTLKTVLTRARKEDQQTGGA
jgi:hypothetical protein